MQRIEAEYEVVTPLMLGGANHAPEFRLASFVGVVRWWWRFLALGRYSGDDATRVAEATARTTFWEAVLFGWSAPPFGRKRVSFRLTDNTPGYPAPSIAMREDMALGTKQIARGGASSGAPKGRMHRQLSSNWMHA